jgi:quinol monooxygenase YgiN
LQQSTELLVVTLAPIVTQKDTEALSQIRSIGDMLRSAPGLISFRYYRSRSNEAYYFLLTTWQDEDSWLHAQERHNPKQLLQAVPDLLASQPEQWLMSYIWGYSRPIAPPTLANAHFMTVRSQHVELMQKGWLQGLHQHSLQLSLSFAFFARTQAPSPAFLGRAKSQGNVEQPSSSTSSIFLCFLSWASDTEREEFYANANYQAMNKFIEGIGSTRVLPLEIF